MAVYTANMRQNEEVGSCGDYYCDANNVCGVRCTEIDLMEANQYAFHSVAHKANDGSGQGNGFGGSKGSKTHIYGPGAGVIDTTRPFSVSSKFSEAPLTSCARHHGGGASTAAA